MSSVIDENNGEVPDCDPKMDPECVLNEGGSSSVDPEFAMYMYLATAAINLIYVYVVTFIKYPAYGTTYVDNPFYYSLAWALSNYLHPLFWGLLFMTWPFAFWTDWGIFKDGYYYFALAAKYVLVYGGYGIIFIIFVLSWILDDMLVDG